MKILVMRGLPGSGKTTNARESYDPKKIAVCSADDWHTYDGVYKYDPAKAGYAHNECYKQFVRLALADQLSETLIVDNTNTSLVEIAPYVRIAEAFGIDYVIRTCWVDLVTAARRNTHNVPFSTLMKMYNNLLNEQLPSWWKQEFILNS